MASAELSVVYSDDDQGRFIKALRGVVGKSLKYAKLIAAEGGDGPCPKTWQTA